MLEGFDSKNYINCSDISNCTDCHDYGTSEDGKCAWCTKKNACVLREPPDKDDPNYVQKYKDFVYFDTHQDDGECSSDKMNCSKKAENDGHPLLKWILIKTHKDEPTTDASTTSQ